MADVELMGAAEAEVVAGTMIPDTFPQIYRQPPRDQGPAETERLSVLMAATLIPANIRRL